MELERKYVGLNHQKGRAVSQVTMEEDLNVPDQKADILKIIHRQGEFRPDEVKGEDGKVKVRGIFLYRILYIGEGNEGMPEVLEGSIPVDEIVFLNETEEGDVLDFHWELEDLHASMIHSRKANLKGILVLAVEAFREQPAALVGSPEDCQDLYLRTIPVRLQQEVIHRKDTLRIKEELNLPPGRPNIRRVLWKEMRLQGTDVRQEEGKLLVKGELVVFFLYESEEDSARLQWLEQSIPFHQEVECESCHADLFGKAEIRLGRAEMDLQPDYDGEPRMLRIDAVLELLLRYFEENTCDVLCDAYSLSREIRPKHKKYDWDFVTNVSDSRARVTGRMKLPEEAPNVLQVISFGGQIHLDHTERNERGLLLQGNVELWVLYAASDDAQPIACAVHSFPFEHTAEMSGLDEKSDWQPFLCMDQLNVGMMDARELEMKAVIQARILFRTPETLDAVEDLEEAPLDLERLKQMPGMVIHVVQPGESLWDIAKSHAATCRAVLEMNEMKEEELKPGQKVLVVKEMAGR